MTLLGTGMLRHPLNKAVRKRYPINKIILFAEPCFIFYKFITNRL